MHEQGNSFLKSVLNSAHWIGLNLLKKKDGQHDGIPPVKKSQSSAACWNGINRLAFVIMVISCLVVSEGGRHGWTEIVSPRRSSRSPLIGRLYFSPGAADCKDTLTKGRALLLSLGLAHVCVMRLFKYLSLSP